jgi:ketosteroid isomerase-like protein
MRADASIDFAECFANDWIAAWNSHDLDRILAHYEDDFEMTSPLIVAFVGEPSGSTGKVRAAFAHYELGSL